MGDDRANLAGLPGEVPNTARRIAAADKLAAQKQWAEAIEEYQRILSEAGDDLVALSPRHAIQARWVCHCRIAALPAEQLAAYRNRVDAQARKWFEQGAAERDARLLRRVVDEVFCSRYGDKALDLLGDLVFERGEFGEARRYWAMIVPPLDEKLPEKADNSACSRLVFPDSKLDAARVQAKQLLARLFGGNRAGIEQALRAYRDRHGKAHGRFAGRQGNYADILQGILDESGRVRRVEETATWPTFGGDACRAARVTGARQRLERICFQPPAWRFSLETHARLDLDAPSRPLAKPLPARARNKAMAFHPVIAGNYVVVADARSVVAYSLHDGTPSTWFDAARDKEALDNLLALGLPAPADLRYSATVAGDCLYARLGVQDFTSERDPDLNVSYLVCLNFKADEKGQRLRWLATPEEAGSGAIFEGAPIVRDGRLYVAVTRLEGGQSITAIHCYPADADGTPHALWRRTVCASQELRGKDRRFRHHLLTLAGSRVVYCSHAGSIVALDAETGRNVWAVRYPSRGGTTQTGDSAPMSGSPRDLAPCIYAAGRLFVAPADYDQLLCLDPATGATIWERGGIETVHLLGVAREKLVFTTTDAIRAVEIATGADVWQMPDEGNFLAPAGRGFLADDLVFWPTARGLKVLQVDDGRLADDFPPGVLDEKLPIERLGNMVYADGCLAVAGLDELVIYLAPGRQRAEREQAVRDRPESAEARLRLAIAQADGGFSQLALESFRRAQELAGPTDEPVCNKARAERHKLLLTIAASAEARHDRPEAACLLESAAAPEFASDRRAQAYVHLAETWTRARDWPRAVAAWQDILDVAALRASRITDGNGNPQGAGVLATLRIGELVRAHGANAYAPIEERARQRLAAAGDDRHAALRELVPQFPNAAAIRAGLSELKEADAKAGRLKLKLATDAKPALSLPLVRAWEIDLDPGERMLLPEGAEARRLADSVIFFAAPHANGGRLTCRDAVSGTIYWSRVLPWFPSWLGCRSDTILVGGRSGVACLNLADGRLAWSFPAAAPLAAFRLAGRQLVFLEDDRRLIALDCTTGECLWTRWAPAAELGLPAPSGRFNSHVSVGSQRLLVQTGSGRRWLLDATTGLPVRDSEGCQRLWPQPPLALVHDNPGTGRFCVPSRSDRVAMLEGRAGQEIWHHELPFRGTLTGELPRVLGDAKSIFVLAPRNYGSSLQRLEPATGKPLWPQEQLLSTEMLGVDQVAFDDRAVYFVAGDVVSARDLSDGHTLWKLPLNGPRGRWRLARVVGLLLASPVDLAEPLQLKRAPIEWTLAKLSLPPLAERDERPTLSLTLIDPRTGQLMQQLNFPLASFARTARKLLDPQPGPDFVLSGEGIVIGVPGRACRFTTLTSEDN
jgi:outer membrane protein assembly factor BamB